MSLRLAAVVIAASAVVVVASCARKVQGACNVDTDCPTGSFCRDTQCAIVGDGGTLIDASTFVCAQPGETCQIDGDCCSPPCNSSGRCAGAGSGSSGRGSSGTSGTSGASGTSGTSGSSGAGCGDTFALCSIDQDCCSMMCNTSGTCQ